ncbi:hypothetical protein A4A49_27949 [Nicotiana attenuata]|uniref:Uncharacterized protein n=1 Tax=Nicotiana attenuata TaxID=49451 RepID=A0A314L2X2_NICAT|nr:hypothetical protein A4A49_27949 [Nicotiana attenuata]
MQVGEGRHCQNQTRMSHCRGREVMEKAEAMLLLMMMNEDEIPLQLLIGWMSRLPTFIPFMPNTLGFLLALSWPACFVVFASWASLA